jgi:hypothetical protein
MTGSVVRKEAAADWARKTRRCMRGISGADDVIRRL